MIVRLSREREEEQLLGTKLSLETRVDALTAEVTQLNSSLHVLVYEDDGCGWGSDVACKMDACSVLYRSTTELTASYACPCPYGPSFLHTSIHSSIPPCVHACPVMIRVESL